MIIKISPFKRFALCATLSSPILLYYPIKAFLVDESNAIQPNKKLKKLIDELAKEQNLKIYDIDLLVKDVLDFEIYYNWLGKSKIIIPKYLQFDSLNDLSSTYINSLLKKKFGVELKEKEKWFSDEGKMIISSFLMNDQAKKFLLAKNLYSLRDEPMIAYYFLSILSFYLPAQLIKWSQDLRDSFIKELGIEKPTNVTKFKENYFKYFYLRYRLSILALFIGIYLNFGSIAYYAIGLKNSRDSDAQAISRGMALALTIKSKTSLMDFNYYSGGEEAYRKLVERNESINKLFFDDLQNDFYRWYKGIPLKKDGNELDILTNRVPIKSAFKNLNEWEKNS